MDPEMIAGDTRLGLPSGIRACLFDLDGVLTQTAAVHRAAWKDTFDPILDEHGQQPFTEADYAQYVDGKPRRDGVRDFLASRGIHPAEGDPGDAADSDTVAGIGNRKNTLLLNRLKASGVKVFQGSIAYLRAVRAAGLRTAIVTASANAQAVVQAAGIEDLVEARVDGVLAARAGLAGKPEPDTYLAAAAALGAEPSQAAVFEDALAGVAAGRAGGFGLVVGVDRTGQAAELRDHGADIVVDDLSELLEVP